jgi:hypothetical protein
MGINKLEVAPQQWGGIMLMGGTPADEREVL